MLSVVFLASGDVAIGDLISTAGGSWFAAGGAAAAALALAGSRIRHAPGRSAPA
jgi:hypothetical protein